MKKCQLKLSALRQLRKKNLAGQQRENQHQSTINYLQIKISNNHCSVAGSNTINRVSSFTPVVKVTYYFFKSNINPEHLIMYWGSSRKEYSNLVETNLGQPIILNLTEE